VGRTAKGSGQHELPTAHFSLLTAEDHQNRTRQ
jgi:hypothetical protein